MEGEEPPALVSRFIRLVARYEIFADFPKNNLVIACKCIKRQYLAINATVLADHPCRNAQLIFDLHLHDSRFADTSIQVHAWFPDGSNGIPAGIILGIDNQGIILASLRNIVGGPREVGRAEVGLRQPRPRPSYQECGNRLPF